MSDFVMRFPSRTYFTLLPAGDVVVHIFLPQQRAFYNLEEFYGNATPIELPFDTQWQ
jgi:ribosomal silencing factor RsfS